MLSSTSIRGASERRATIAFDCAGPRGGRHVGGQTCNTDPNTHRTGRLAFAATAVCCGGMLGGMGMLRGAGPQQLTHPAPSRGEEKGWFGSLLNIGVGSDGGRKTKNVLSAPLTRRGVGPTLRKEGRHGQRPNSSIPLIFWCLAPCSGGPAGCPQGPLGRCGFWSYALAQLRR